MRTRATSRSRRSADRRAVGRRGAAALLALVAVLAAGCDRSAEAGGARAEGPVAAAAPEDPIAFGEVPPFALVDQRGEPLSRADLGGAPWAATCIYTTCTGPCPSVTRTIAELARKLEGTACRFVSVTVDPERDTPAVLARYAEAFDADPERWSFVTGEPEAVRELVTGGFKLPYARLAEPDPETGDEITHDVRIVAVDQEGRIRGWYRADDPEEVGRLGQRMRHLAREAAAR